MAVILLATTSIGIVIYTYYLCSNLSSMLLGAFITLAVAAVVLIVLFSAITRLAAEKTPEEERRASKEGEHATSQQGE